MNVFFCLIICLHELRVVLREEHFHIVCKVPEQLTPGSSLAKQLTS